MQDGTEGIWFRTSQDEEADRKIRFDEVAARLESFNKIETKIKKDLVEETNELISRVSFNVDQLPRSH